MMRRRRRRSVEVKTQDLVVENYSLHKGMAVGKAIQSDEEFVCGGQRWALRLFPQGYNAVTHDGGFASACIARISHAAHVVQLTCDFTLLDQSGRDQHLRFAAGFHRGYVTRIPPRELLAGRPDFIRRTQLDSPDSPYLKDDSLKFRVRLGVFNYYSDSDDDGTYSDDDDEFVFIRGVADRVFCAVKSALARRCPKLLSYHDGHLQDLAIDPHARPRAFSVALQYISTGSIEKNLEEEIHNSDPNNLESFAAKLLAATNLLELEPLKGMCEASLSKKISTQSIGPLLHLAIICNATQLHAHCLTFAALNRLVIMECDGRKLFNPYEGFKLCSTPIQDDCAPTFTELVKHEVFILYKTIGKLGRQYWSWLSPKKIKKYFKVGFSCTSPCVGVKLNLTFP